MASLKSLGVPAQFLTVDLSSVERTQPTSWFEKHILGQLFRDERLSLGPSQVWLARTWELRLGSVRGLIYKVGLEAVASGYEDAVELSAEVMEQISRTFGTPQQRDIGLWLWDADDGNVVVQLANVNGERRVMVFLTSRVAQSLQKKSFQ